MSSLQNPCDHCTPAVCDYRRCDAYRKWLNAAWLEFHRYVQRCYWKNVAVNSKKFTYEHPDLIRRYLLEGPCAQCSWDETCQIPCNAYWCWWDARMIWLRWRLLHADISHRGGN